MLVSLLFQKSGLDRFFSFMRNTFALSAICRTGRTTRITKIMVTFWAVRALAHALGVFNHYHVAVAAGQSRHFLHGAVKSPVVNQQVPFMRTFASHTILTTALFMSVGGMFTAKFPAVTEYVVPKLSTATERLALLAL